VRRDHVRDYATEAFRFYAKVGGTKKYIDDLVADEKRQKGSGVANPTEAALIIKERILAERAAEFADLEAVEKTMHIISTLGSGKEMRQAVEMVYFERCWEELRRGDIQDRVHKAELTIPASERSIYYWLKKARLIFAKERGLRL
jgi:hypothetical protein